jgi:phage shock protein PspC (stress-responsive transcriptional regulator)
MTDDGDMTDTTRTRNTKSTRLERSREDRIFAGVAGGLGEHLGVNPWLFRFAFIILTFFGGFGVLLYIAAWLVIPDEGQQESIIARWIGNLDMSDAGTIFGVVLVGAAALIVLGQFANVSGTLIVALVLFVIGFLLYRGDLTTRRTPKDQPPEVANMTDNDDLEASKDAPGDATEGGKDSTQEVDSAVLVASHTDQPPSYDDSDTEEPATWEPPPPPERSMLGRITIAIGLIVIASMALIDVAFERVEIEPVEYLAVGVAIVGIGLLVGSWIGKARWLIIVGVAVLPLLWLSTLAPSNWDFSAGEVQYRPLTVAEVQSPYEHGFGQMVIDLTVLTPEELAEVGTIEASLTAGEMIVRLPSDTGVLLQAEVGMGQILGPFDTQNGIGLNASRTVGPDPVVLVLDLEVGAGVIDVTGATGFAPSDALILEGSNS